VKEEFAPSLLNFFKELVSPRLLNREINVLDIGAGTYSIFEKTNLDKRLIETIDLKQDLVQINESPIKYLQGNITKLNCLKNNYYDLVFDSHCLHCLKTTDDQELALDNIYKSLRNDGLFATEMMVQPSKNNVYFPERLVNEALEIERLILNTGFKIIYFVIVPQLNFYYETGDREITCDMLRVLAKK
jgi:ubiquinone/menaquinone biosynthesis C-methylase UbiE